MDAPTAKGLATDEWEAFDEKKTELTTKEALLSSYDDASATIEKYWMAITMEKLQEKVNAFGQYEGTGYSTLFYIIDSEIHHRGQDLSINVHWELPL